VTSACRSSSTSWPSTVTTTRGWVPTAARYPANVDRSMSDWASRRDTLDCGAPGLAATLGCVQNACERPVTDHQRAHGSTRANDADLVEHHQPRPDNTGHHTPGSPLNLRVRGSSPWRRTMSDLAFCTCWPICATNGAGPKRANACKKRARLARIEPQPRNLRVRSSPAGRCAHLR
jgi:hypothetical protein